MKKKIKPICISGAAKYEVGATTRSVYILILNAYQIWGKREKSS